MLQGQRAQRIEMLLLHEFYQRKFLLPDKLKAKDRERLTKAAAKARQLAMEGDVCEEAQEEKSGQFLGWCCIYCFLGGFVSC